MQETKNWNRDSGKELHEYIYDIISAGDEIQEVIITNYREGKSLKGTGSNSYSTAGSWNCYEPQTAVVIVNKKNNG